MSEQNHTTQTTQLPRPVSRAELTEHQRRVLDGEVTRTDHVVSWLGWHLGELCAVGLPLLFAAAFTWWLAGLSVLAGALWAAHDALVRRRHRTPHTGGTQPRPSPAAVPDGGDESATPGGSSAAEHTRVSA